MTREDAQDAALLNRAKHDSEAFATFYRSYVRSVLAFFMVRTRDPEVAADLTAETFAAVLAGVSRYSSHKAPPRAWLFGIAHNKLVDSYRLKQVEDRMRHRLQMQPIELNESDLKEIKDLTASDIASRALDALPKSQKAAIREYVLNERTYNEIAENLTCSPAVVRQRVSRGLRTARKIIEET
ncbi:MAG: RNA polymerase sigma factor [Solirubrobacteraceae bacterium]